MTPENQNPELSSHTTEIPVVQESSETVSIDVQRLGRPLGVVGLEGRLGLLPGNENKLEKRLGDTSPEPNANDEEA